MSRAGCLLVLLAVGGCGSASEDLARRAAGEFESALASDRPERAC